MKPELNRSPAPVVSSTANPLNAFCSTRSVPRMATHPLSPKVTTAISHHSANLASAASILVSCSMESLLASPPPTSSLASSSLAEKLKKNTKHDVSHVVHTEMRENKLTKDGVDFTRG